MQIHIPAQLSKERNLKFRQLYKKHFNEELSIADADKEAYRLLSFFAIIIENTPKYYKD
jgi:hypothetical protein